MCASPRTKRNRAKERTSMGREKKAKGRRGAGGRKKLALLLCAVLIGYYLGFRLPEEERGRKAKLLREGREMWFRLFV